MSDMEQRMHPVDGVERDRASDTPLTLRAWQERLLNGMLYAAAALGLPALISGSITAIRDGQLDRIAIFSIAYAFILLITFVRKRIPYSVRAGGLVLLGFGLGVDSLRSTGLGGSGRIFLIALAIIATLLFGLRGGLIALGAALLATVGVGWAMGTGLLPITPEVMSSTDPASWMTGGAVFALLSTMLVISLGILQRGLQGALRGQQDLVKRLSEQREELEKDITERTGDLQRQSLQLETTAEIARLTTETDDLQELMSRAIELIRSRFGFYHASIFLLDSTGTWADIAASTGEAGQLLLERHHRLAVGSASIIGWVMANRLPRVSADVEDDPFYFRNPALPDTQAEMTVPIMVGQRLIGALDVQSSEKGAFGEADMRAVEAIAGELAFAIDNARLTEERQARLEELETRVRERIHESWSEYARSASPTIIHIGAAGSGVGAAEGEFPGLDEATMRGETFVGEAGREVVVPVRVRGETIAAIAARKPEEDETWSNEDISLIESVASQAALALETARQYAEEQRRVAELEVVNRISQAASQLLRLDTLLRMVGRQVHGVLGGTGIAIGLYDETEDEVSFPYVMQQGDELELPPQPASEGLEGVVIRSRQPLLLRERLPEQAAELGARIHDKPPKSWLGVPMLVGDQLIGVLVVEDKEASRRFTEEDAALLSTISGQMATALQNARLLEQVQKSARRERLIHEISSKVRQSPDISTVLETTAREVGRALNVTRAEVRLGRRVDEESPDGDGASPPEGGQASSQETRQ